MMVKYKITIYWSDEDQAFIAEVPELAGCAADGASYQKHWLTQKEHPIIDYQTG